MKRALIVSFIVLFFGISAQAQQWTIMLYFMSDNNLYSYVADDILELTNIYDTPGVNFIVQIDSWQGARRYKVDNQGLHLLAYLGNVNSGNPETLVNFGTWAADQYPSKYNALVLWDHGDGWSKGSKYIGYDNQYFDYLSVSQGELKKAVGKIVAQLGKPFDLVVMDACGMQMAEVLMEFQDLSRFVAGSQAVFPLSGLAYDIAFTNLSKLSPENVAVQVVNSCKIEYLSDPGVTFSAVDINKLATWAGACRTFVNEVSISGSNGRIDAQSMKDSVQSYSGFESYDLYEVLSYFSDQVGGDLSDQAITLKKSLLECIISEFHNPGRYEESKGLSVWLSSSDYGFNSRSNEYWHLNWTKQSWWDLFLCNTIGIPDISAPIVQNLTVNKIGDNDHRLSWNGSYDQNRIDAYQVRIIPQSEYLFYDDVECPETKKLVLSGFSVIASNAGYLSDHAYYLTNGAITTAEPIEIDSNGGIGWMMKAQRGYCYLQISGDTSTGWDTLAKYPGYFDTTWSYNYVSLPRGLNWIRWSWSTESSGWAYIDDIKSPICSKDSTIIAQTKDTFLTVTQTALFVSDCQVRAIDGKGNVSYWSMPVNIKTGKIVKQHIWPNPSSGEVNWLVRDKLAKQPKIMIFNLLGQKVATPKMVDWQYVSAEGLYRYYFKWRAEENSLFGVAAGIYIYKIVSSDAAMFGRFVLIK